MNTLIDDDAPLRGRVYMPGDTRLWKSYEVERLTKKRLLDGEWFYLVRWAGWKSTHDCWVAREELTRTALDYLTKFERRRPKKVQRLGSNTTLQSKRGKERCREKLGPAERLATLCKGCRLPIDGVGYREKSSAKMRVSSVKMQLCVDGLLGFLWKVL